MKSQTSSALARLCAAAALHWLALAPLTAAPGLIVTTDIGGDPDDQQSIRRLMLYANEFNILGLIASAAGTPGQLGVAVTKPQEIHYAIDEYERVRTNLTSHAAGYPTAAHLRTLVKSGNPQRGTAYVGAGHDTAGSNHIVAQVDAATGPVNIAIWGGATDVAQAFHHVHADPARSAAAKAQWVAKVRICSISDQDGAGTTLAWIRTNYPDALVIEIGQSSLGSYHKTFRGMYQNDSLSYGETPIQLVETANVSLNQTAWLRTHVTRDHGELGTGIVVGSVNTTGGYPDQVAQIPPSSRNTTGVKEGDTPSWFYFLSHGLGDPDQPGWGGWGGRYAPVANRYWNDVNALDTHWSGNTSAGLRRKWTVARWRAAFQHEFAARMDWCVKPYAEANHNPAARLNGDTTKAILQVQAAPGAVVTLNAAGSTDPDGDSLAYRWWVYQEAGTYAGAAAIASPLIATTSLTVPADAAGKTIHVILEVKDAGSPALTSYRRLVIDVAASSSAPALNAHWKLDEAVGTVTAVDSSGNGNHGAVSGSPVWPGDGTLQFDGVNDHVQAASNAGLNLTKNFTLAAWIKPAAATGAHRTLLAKLTGVNDKQFQFAVNAAGALQFDYEKSGNNYALSGGAVQAGVWQHAAVTVDPARNVALYLDGVQVAGGTAPAEVSATANPVAIGRSGGTYNSLYFAGAMDDVRVYSGALTASQVADLLGGAFQETGGQVDIEAEDHTGAALRSDPNGLPWIGSTFQAGYQGTGYVTTATPSGTNYNGTWANAAELAYDIDFVTAGSYHVWVRRYAASASDNSGFGGFDGVALSGYDNNDSAFGVWTWVKLGTVNLAPGRHTFQLRRREASYRVDRIVITTGSATPN